MSQEIMKYQQKELKAEREKNKELCDRIAVLEQEIHLVIQMEDRILLYENGVVSCPFCRRELDHDYDGNYVEGHSIGCIWVSFCNLLDKDGAE